jgi:hypothetical protein
MGAPARNSLLTSGALYTVMPPHRHAFGRLFLNAGGEAVERPFDIAIGRCARVRDPFGDVLVILDQSKGLLVTDADGRVTGVRAHSPD